MWGLGWSSFFALWMSRYTCIICCEDYLSFTELLLHFCQKSLGIFVWVSFWVLCYLFKYWIALDLWNKSWYIIIFIYCWIVFASIFWRIFCICIHEGHQSVLSVLFVWFWYHNISFISNLGSSLLFILFLKEMVQSQCYFFKYLVDFSSITTWAQILHFGVLLNEKFSFINSYRLFKLSILCWIVEVCVFWEIGPFHINCQIYMHIVVHSIFLWIFWCWQSL